MDLEEVGWPGSSWHRIGKLVGNSLNSWRPIRFSRGTLLRGASK
jgi:hypothetical protein